MNRSIADRIELARSAPVPWNSRRAAQVSERIIRRRRGRVARSLFLECAAVALASTALLLGLIRISAGAEDTVQAVPAVENSPTPARAVERVLYADGALGDGGYEASLQ